MVIEYPAHLGVSHGSVSELGEVYPVSQYFHFHESQETPRSSTRAGASEMWLLIQAILSTGCWEGSHGYLLPSVATQPSPEGRPGSEGTTSMWPAALQQWITGPAGQLNHHPSVSGCCARVHRLGLQAPTLVSIHAAGWGKWSPKSQEEPDFGPWSDRVDLGGCKCSSLDRWPYSKLDVRVETSVWKNKVISLSHPCPD